MSDGEENLKGGDEKDLREHFAPVGQSLKRMVTSRSIQAYAVSFIGVIVLSASIGGVVVGTYATFQEDFGLCGNPILTVESPESFEALAAEDEVPNLTRLEYEELTPDEQRGFRRALNAVNNEAEVEGNIEHLPAFRNGAIVTYRGEEYYVAVGSLNECVPVDVLSLPLSIVGMLVGAGLYVAPGLWKRFR